MDIIDATWNGMGAPIMTLQNPDPLSYSLEELSGGSPVAIIRLIIPPNAALVMNIGE